MDEHNVVHIYNGIVFSHEEKGSPAICNNIDETGGKYINENKPDI
jgi:hypothetical protein